MSASDKIVEKSLSVSAIHESWEGKYRTPDNELFLEKLFGIILKNIPLPRNSFALDAGCGIGAHSIRLSKHGYKVKGIDFSESVIPNARAYVAKHGLSATIDIEQGNLLQLKFQDNCFDLVLCWGVLMHIPEIEQALNELIRVVRPGGYLVISENNINSMHYKRIWITFNSHAFSRFNAKIS